MAEMDKIIEEQRELNDKKKTNKKDDEIEIAKALSFYIEDRTYGVEIDYVNEIIGVPHITVIPGVPDYIKGVINVRSKVVPVVDVRTRFGLPEREYDDKTCTIIIEYRDIQVGIIVDTVREVLSITKAAKADIPSLERLNDNKFIQYILEVKDVIKMILDVKKLIFDDDFDMHLGEEEV